MNEQQNVVIFESNNGAIDLHVELKDDTVWLSQKQMEQLFGRERSVITKHINNVFKEGELERDSVCANFAHTAEDGKSYRVMFYNLDVIISVGYRVKSQRGTQFRIWATNVLKEHLIKGYSVNQTRLQQKGLDELNQTMTLLHATIEQSEIGLNEAKGMLDSL